jgi:hypothetical protein
LAPLSAGLLGSSIDDENWQRPTVDYKSKRGAHRHRRVRDLMRHDVKRHELLGWKI